VRAFIIYLVFTTFLTQTLYRPLAVATVSSLNSSEEYMKVTVEVLKSLKTYGNLIDFAARKSDRPYLRKELNKYLQSPIKAQYVERETIALSLGAERASVKVTDLAKGHFEILKREFVFDPNESAEAGVKRLGKILNQASHTKLFESEAQAIAFLGILFYIWLTSSVALSTSCMMSVNTPAWCALSFGWPLFVGWMAAGAVYRTYFDKKDYLKDLNLELKEIKCSEGDKPMRLTLADKEGHKLTTEVYFKNVTIPDRIEIKSPDQDPVIVNLAKGWSYDTDRPMVAYPNSKLKTTQDVLSMIQAMKDLSKACLDPETRTMFEKYSELQNADGKPAGPTAATSGTQTTK
jgi:hypothetical protein